MLPREIQCADGELLLRFSQSPACTSVAMVRDSSNLDELEARVRRLDGYRFGLGSATEASFFWRILRSVPT